MGHIYVLSQFEERVSQCCPFCNNDKPLNGYNTFDYLYPELAKLWAPNNKVSIDSFVPLLTEKGFIYGAAKNVTSNFMSASALY